jgi:hypothetical protein
MTNIKKGFWLETKPTTAEDDDEDSTELENVDNSIFFYTSVTKKSVLELNKKKTNLLLVFMIRIQMELLSTLISKL